MKGQAAHLAGAAPKHPSLLLLQQRRTVRAQPCPAKPWKRQSKTEQGNRHQLEDLLNLKALPSPCRKSKLGGKRLFRRKKAAPVLRGTGRAAVRSLQPSQYGVFRPPEIQQQGGLIRGQLLPAMLKLPMRIQGGT